MLTPKYYATGRKVGIRMHRCTYDFFFTNSIRYIHLPVNYNMTIACVKKTLVQFFIRSKHVLFKLNYIDLAFN